jgi:hypothetical protein
MNIDIYENYIYIKLNEYMISLKRIIFWDKKSIIYFLVCK